VGICPVAIGLLFEGPGVTQAQYDQTRNEVSPDNKRAAGMLYHVAGPTGNGGWRVVEVWESQEALDRFFQEKLGKALQNANISIQPQTFQVHNIMQ
jgi:quinol monooxygenase YgiN